VLGYCWGGQAVGDPPVQGGARPGGDGCREMARERTSRAAGLGNRPHESSSFRSTRAGRRSITSKDSWRKQRASWTGGKGVPLGGEVGADLAGCRVGDGEQGLDVGQAGGEDQKWPEREQASSTLTRFRCRRQGRGRRRRRNRPDRRAAGPGPGRASRRRSARRPRPGSVRRPGRGGRGGEAGAGHQEVGQQGSPVSLKAPAPATWRTTTVQRPGAGARPRRRRDRHRLPRAVGRAPGSAGRPAGRRK